jgi:hypothetical protein
MSLMIIGALIAAALLFALIRQGLAAFGRGRPLALKVRGPSRSARQPRTIREVYYPEETRGKRPSGKQEQRRSLVSRSAQDKPRLGKTVDKSADKTRDKVRVDKASAREQRSNQAPRPVTQATSSIAPPQKDYLVPVGNGRRGRRSSRVSWQAPIVVIWEASDGLRVREQAETRVVNVHGALLRLGTALRPGKRITLFDPRSKESRSARVVTSQRNTASTALAGVELNTPGEKFWGVYFPI